MIPNPNYNNNLNIFDGNIDLNPSYVDAYEVGYSISKKSFTINPTLYYRHQTDDVKTITYSQLEKINDEDQIVVHTKPVNVGTDDRIGLEVNFTWDATKWLKFLGNVDGFRYSTTGTYFTTDVPMKQPLSFEGKGVSMRSRLTSTFKLDKTLSFQVQGFYGGPRKTASQDRQSMYAVNFGASKTVLNGNGTISFNIQDVFNTRAMRMVNYNGDFTSENYMQWQPRQFALSFTYKFKQGEKVEQPKRKKDINSNATGGDEQGPM